jgi:DNA-binding HxlR family transcriptional regulator
MVLRRSNASDIGYANKLQAPAVKILVHLQKVGESRHSDLEELIGSRGTLAENLNDLLSEGLVKRKVVPTKPIQSNYSLTEKGQQVAKRLTELGALLKQHAGK